MILQKDMRWAHGFDEWFNLADAFIEARRDGCGWGVGDTYGMVFDQRSTIGVSNVSEVGFYGLFDLVYGEQCDEALYSDQTFFNETIDRGMCNYGSYQDWRRPSGKGHGYAKDLYYSKDVSRFQYDSYIRYMAAVDAKVPEEELALDLLADPTLERYEEKTIDWNWGSGA